MKAYKLKKGYALVVYIGAPLLIMVFIALILSPIWDKNADMNTHWIFIVLGLIMIPFMFLGLIHTIKSGFVIGADSIYTTSALATRELRLDEIKGYRFINKYIVVEPFDSNKKKLKVSIYLSDDDEIVRWFEARYPNLDKQLAEEEELQILNDENLGGNEEERQLKLKRAKTVAGIANWASGLAAAWLFIYPEPYRFALLAALCSPLICILTAKLSTGLIRFDERKGSPYPSVIAGLFLPAAALGMRAIIDYKIDDLGNFWAYLLGVTCVLVAVLFTGSREFDLRSRQGIVVFIGITVLMAAYGFGAIIGINCSFDHSAPEVHHARVLNRHIVRGKITSYNLNVTPWGIHTEAREVEVHKTVYESLHEGDEVTIHLMPGRLNIPWHEVTASE